MPKSYDIIVVGAGSAGIGASVFTAKVGLKTLLIDKSEEAIGGDCLNFGCVPSKALIHAARQVAAAKEAGSFGLNVEGVADLAKAMQYVRNSQASVRRHENKEFFEKMGMDVAIGAACFETTNSIRVGDNVYQAKKIVLATGSRPRKLDTPGLESVPVYTNETIFNLEALPENLLVVGGGPIGCELGQAFSMLGSKVTILQSAPRLLPNERPEISDILIKQFEKGGIDARVNSRLLRFEGDVTAIAQSGGEEIVIPCNAVLAAIGRELVLDPLKLEKGGVEVRDGRIVLDDKLRTANRNVFVCGDLAGGLMFSHAAELHVRLLLNNLFSPFTKKLDTSHFSWVTFTTPEVATFGRQADQLDKEGVSHITLEHDFEHDDRATTDDYQYGKLFLYLSKGNLFRGGQKILGGTMIAPGAGELIQELILANTSGLSASDIFNKIYPYPTGSRVNQMAIVDYQETRLSPLLQKVLRGLYSIK